MLTANSLNINGGWAMRGLQGCSLGYNKKRTSCPTRPSCHPESDWQREVHSIRSVNYIPAVFLESGTCDSFVVRGGGLPPTHHLPFPLGGCREGRLQRLEGNIGNITLFILLPTILYRLHCVLLYFYKSAKSRLLQIKPIENGFIFCTFVCTVQGG